MVQYTYKGYSRARELCVWLLMARRGQSIKIDIGKPINKSITIDKANLTIINCIDQSIKIDTHTVLGLKVVFHSRMNFFLLVGQKLFLLHYINHQVAILMTPLIDTPLLW